MNNKNKYDNTPLHVAALNDHREIYEILIASKADVMLQNYENKLCRDVAEDFHHPDAVDFLDYHIRRETMWRNRNCLLKIGVAKD